GVRTSRWPTSTKVTEDPATVGRRRLLNDGMIYPQITGGVNRTCTVKPEVEPDHTTTTDPTTLLLQVVRNLGSGWKTLPNLTRPLSPGPRTGSLERVDVLHGQRRPRASPGHRQTTRKEGPKLSCIKHLPQQLAREG